MILKSYFFTCALIFIFQLSDGLAQIAPQDSPYNDFGNYVVLSETVTSTTPDLKIFRPDNTAETYPILFFQLGANPLFGDEVIDADTYDLFLEHLASYGYIVVVIDDASAGLPDASDFEEAYDWYEDKLTDTNHWMSDQADDEHVIVGGHSLGGVKASAFVNDFPEKVQGVVYFAAYPSQGVFNMGAHDVTDFDGYVLSLAGDEDDSSSPEECYEGYEAFENAECKYWVLIEGLAHGGFGDYENPDQPVGTMGRDNATASIRHFLVSFMEHTFKGNSAAETSLKESSNQPESVDEYESNCPLQEEPNSVVELDQVFNIYPNPVTEGVLFIEFGQTVDQAQIRVFDMFGRLIMEEHGQGNRLELNIPSSLHSGQYVLDVATKAYRFTEKIIIQ